MNRRRVREQQARRSRGRLARWLWILALVAVLAPLAVLLVLRWLPAPTSSFMLQARFGGLGDGAICRRVAYQWVAWEQISDRTKMAVIASEDQRFADHWGFDFESIGDALQEGDDGGRLRGASTISQQTAKNLFLWPAHSWFRKGLEAYFTVLLELSWPKQRILETYLNIAQFGPCTFGVAAAAKQYFGTSAAALDARRSALLAAVLPNPLALRVDHPSPYLERRVQWIESQMRHLGGARYLQELP